MSRPKPPPAPPPPRAGGLLPVILSAAGLGIALALARVHAQAGSGTPSFCSLGGALDCDRVAQSPYASLLGVPVALWGAFAYGLMLLLSLARLRPRLAAAAAWPAGLLVLLSAAAALASVPLALVSALALRTLCLLCAVTWVVDWALLAAALRQARAAGGPRRAVAGTLAELAAHPARALAAAGAASAAVAAGVTALAWAVAPITPPHAAATAPAPALAPAPAPAPAPAGAAAPGPAAPLVVFEFSDYECPHCARAHEALRATLASRPDVRVEHRNFPLDDACNPAVPRPFHREACALARAALCAGDQGRFQEMNDALFANQTAKRPVEELAQEVGLDLAAFGRCRESPETAHRLAEEIASGIRAGVVATPTYAVGRALYQGAIPPGALGR